MKQLVEDSTGELWETILDQCRTCAQCKPRVKLVIYVSGFLISVSF